MQCGKSRRHLGLA